ncbi:alpha/beta hydrolase [Oceanobacillus senegalensis]|uniref:alpha/beta hydrolase n=1 Tax=Oceanobacillus senegalensis TaxID=1936063 RepID=UPI000A312860|nr:alpha/beta hydrolase [Oceanobacillus senegalensis]
MEEKLWIQTEDQTAIFVKKWYNRKVQPKAIIQLAHGMAEHVGRYEAFAEELLKNKIFVYGNDHRGHGQTGLKQGLLGYFADNHGFYKTMEDLNVINEKIKKEYPNIPIILLGHSMGSFLARLYVTRYSHSIDGLILSGTGYYSAIAIKSAKILSSMLPAKKQSKLMNHLTFGNYNKKVQHHETDFDWLSGDEQVVQQYIDDPLSGFVPTARFFVDLMTGIHEIQDPSNVQLIRKNLPVLIISGDEDPVGDFEKGVWKSAHLFDKAGIENITVSLFPGARHEVLNEVNKREIQSVIYKWIANQLSYNS